MPCEEVNVEEPIPNESALVIDSFTVDPGGPNQATVDFTVRNEVFSGSGSTRDVEVEISVNNSTVDTVETTLSAGRTESFEVELDSIESGEAEICAVIV